jgi:hypothetical protein
MGIIGETGPQGPVGPPGIDGVSGYEIVKAGVEWAGDYGIGTASCPDGKRVFGGGWWPALENEIGLDDAFVFGSYPLNESAWYVVIRDPSTAGISSFSVYAICGEVQ